jgi:hypothetical protein
VVSGLYRAGLESGILISAHRSLHNLALKNVSESVQGYKLSLHAAATAQASREGGSRTDIKYKYYIALHTNLLVIYIIRIESRPRLALYSSILPTLKIDLTSSNSSSYSSPKLTN